MITRTEQITCDKCGMKFKIRSDAKPSLIQLFCTDITIVGVSLVGKVVSEKLPIHLDLCPVCYNKLSEFLPERVTFTDLRRAKK